MGGRHALADPLGARAQAHRHRLVKVLATGLAAGILLYATVIRALLVPAVVSLFGRWNWWLPHWPARLVRVEPSLPPGTAGATDSA